MFNLIFVRYIIDKKEKIVNGVDNFLISTWSFKKIWKIALERKLVN